VTDLLTQQESNFVTQFQKVARPRPTRPIGFHRQRQLTESTSDFFYQDILSTELECDGQMDRQTD